MMPLAAALELYDLWVQSNYVALPFPGSLMEQPYWVRRTFNTLSHYESWWRQKIDKEQGKYVRDAADAADDLIDRMIEEAHQASKPRTIEDILGEK